MSSELAKLREELNAISRLVKIVQETGSIKCEVTDIRRLVGAVQETASIRKEVEAITKEVEEIKKKAASGNSEVPKEDTSAKEKAEADAKAKAEADAKAKAEADAKAKAEADAKAKAEADAAAKAKAKAEADAKAKAEADAKAKAEANAKAKAEADAKAKAEADAKAKAEAEAKAKADSEAKAKAKAASQNKPKSKPKASSSSSSKGGLVSSELEDAYNEIRKHDGSIDWVLMTYASNTKLQLEASGKGGVEALTSYCNEKALFFAYCKVRLGGSEDSESGSPCKFILISFAGDRAPFIRKAKMGVHRAVLKDVFRDFAREFQASEADDITPEIVLAAVKKSAGANYAGQSSYR